MVFDFQIYRNGVKCGMAELTIIIANNHVWKKTQQETPPHPKIVGGKRQIDKIIIVLFTTCQLLLVINY